MVPLKIQLPIGFLDEETRCGYTIPSKMKEIWAVQLDLLEEFTRVCKKNNICFIASGGTMLGAVRHQGFIPWDDDIDLMMPRDDYNRLCAIAPSEFKHPYFFQTEYTDHGFMRGFARLRNSETAGIQTFEYKKRYGFNQGIFIDVFPMDEVVSDTELLSKQGNQAHRLYSWACVLSDMTDRFPPNKKPHWKYIYKLCGHYILGLIINKLRLPDYYFKQFEKVCAKYNGTNQTKWSLLSFQFDNRRHDLSFNKNDILFVDFEFTKIPIPGEFDEHLKNKYGNYMQPRQIPNYHGDVIFNTCQSYKSVLDL